MRKTRFPLARDLASGVWRVIQVYGMNDNVVGLALNEQHRVKTSSANTTTRLAGSIFFPRASRRDVGKEGGGSARLGRNGRGDRTPRICYGYGSVTAEHESADPRHLNRFRSCETRRERYDALRDLEAERVFLCGGTQRARAPRARCTPGRWREYGAANDSLRHCTISAEFENFAR
jgi:hypothetical protein